MKKTPNTKTDKVNSELETSPETTPRGEPKGSPMCNPMQYYTDHFEMWNIQNVNLSKRTPRFDSLQIGDILSFAPQKILTFHSKRYEPNWSFKVVDFAFNKVYLDPIESVDQFANKKFLQQGIVKPFYILKYFWYRHTKEEIIINKVLFGERSK